MLRQSCWSQRVPVRWRKNHRFWELAGSDPARRRSSFCFLQNRIQKIPTIFTRTACKQQMLCFPGILSPPAQVVEINPCAAPGLGYFVKSPRTRDACQAVTAATDTDGNTTQEELHQARQARRDVRAASRRLHHVLFSRAICGRCSFWSRFQGDDPGCKDKN